MIIPQAKIKREDLVTTIATELYAAREGAEIWSRSDCKVAEARRQQKIEAAEAIARLAYLLAIDQEVEELTQAIQQMKTLRREAS